MKENITGLVIYLHSYLKIGFTLPQTENASIFYAGQDVTLTSSTTDACLNVKLVKNCLSDKKTVSIMPWVACSFTSVLNRNQDTIWKQQVTVTILAATICDEGSVLCFSLQK